MDTHTFLYGIYNSLNIYRIEKCLESNFGEKWNINCISSPVFFMHLAVSWVTVHFGDLIRIIMVCIHFTNTYLLTYLFTYLISYLLTTWSWVLLEKLTVFQLVSESPTFYVTQKFITAFTSNQHLSLCRASSIKSASRRFILILPFQVVSFTQISPPKQWMWLSSPPCVVHAQTISFFSTFSPKQYWVRSTDH